MSSLVKVGFCVAYDWELLKISLPPVYKHADRICMSIDKNRKSWRGESYLFNEEQFRLWLSSIDTLKKIDVYEDEFSNSSKRAFENEGRQRSLMATRLGKGGWHIQIDCDEYFTDFKGYKDFLIRLNPNPTGEEKAINVSVFLFDLFKKVNKGYLIIENRKPFSAPFATTRPEYKGGRQNGHFNKLSPFFVIHETWSRDEAELKYKLSNWGHSTDEFAEPAIQESYIKLWSALDQHNYSFVRNFHFAVPHYWEKIKFVPAQSIEELLANFRPQLNIGLLKLFFANSRLLAKIRQLLGK